MSQVNGRETNNFDDEANLDIYYIENWSILLDIKILFKTIYVVLTRK
ncbi:UDP-Gal::undecaprenolphosphate Gal-1-P transferase [bacterium]|jgi:lipopolysaccharide/colanic/teichoic acid biosynthesis glycosyltransferase|nr:UDP-Gal::undecaprenolphosphate Gal-1-P transferase [bacterium]MBT4633001.1 UDP-Gal::undecaprenolphosphate Gal-1-P transferase [bacterium]MBT5492056.1 UDP-Gal::undecaprenolphosphate Gal-1-P transferase [bacterium]MBT6778811.1 UDP-Gal::undecaprenolphosphate Gal-1-P transferase [bacterium]